MSVTTDLSMLKGWPKMAQPRTSAEIAAHMGLTVFQITARLKGMEGRGFVARIEGKWVMTPAGKSERDNPSPSISGASKTMRAKDSTGNHSGPPDDSSVTRLRLVGADWAPSDQSFKSAQQRLPEIRLQIEQRRAIGTNTPESRRVLAAFQLELEHCLEITRKPRKGKWTSRAFKEQIGAEKDGTPIWRSQTLYIAPDTREYVYASPYETADLLIEAKVAGLSPSRLRLFSTSAAAKAVRKATNAQKETVAREEAKTEQTVREIAALTIPDIAQAAEIAFAPRPSSQRKSAGKTGKAKLHGGGDKTRNALRGRKKARR